MSEEITALDEMKRRIKIEQVVREFLRVLDDNEMIMEEGLVAWNMLGFTMFQDLFPEKPHAEIQAHLIAFSNSLFDSMKR